MKFDRSDRDPLAFGSSIPVSSPPLSPLSRAISFVSSPGRNLESCKMVLAHSSPGFPHLRGAPRAPTGTDGHRRPSRTTCPPHPLPSPRSLMAHPILYDSLLSVTSLPLPPPTPPVMLPRGHPLKRVSLVPTRHLFTNTSHGLLAPCRLSLPGPVVSYRCPIVTLRRVGGGA